MNWLSLSAIPFCFVLLTESGARMWMSPVSENREASTMELSSRFQKSRSDNPAIEHLRLADEIFQRSAQELRCSDGEVWELTTQNGLSMYVAIFKWDAVSSGSVMEAFRHNPKDCLGSIGMRFVAENPPRVIQIAGQKIEFTSETFEDSDSNPLLPSYAHSFRGVWMDSSTSFTKRENTSLRSEKLAYAWQRKLPNHARVMQGAVRGTTSPDVAWEAFKKLFLSHLVLQ